MKRARCLFATLACLALCGPARADRSALADADGVIEAGDCEIETAFERRTARGSAAQRAAAMQLVCGIGWRTELAVTFARQRVDTLRQVATGMEVKTSLRERGSVGAGVGWTLAWGAGTERNPGGRWRSSEHFVAIEASLEPRSAWLIEARLATLRERAAHRYSTQWALAVEHALSATLEARAEIEGDDRGRPLTSLGLRYALWPDHALLSLSYAFSAGPARERRARIGITFEF